MQRYNKDDQEDRRVRKRMLVYCVFAASLVMLGFLYMIYRNNEERHKRLAAQERVSREKLEAMKEEQRELEEMGVGQNNLRSEDLDFWDMYEPEAKPASEDEDEYTVDKPPVTPLPRDNGSTAKKSSDTSGTQEEAREIEPEALGDRDHIKIIEADGKTIYYEIMDEVPKNEYAFEGSLSMKNGRLSYNDGDISSLNGVTVSKSQGPIDWQRVRADGTDFAMIKVASRGYDSGIISLDESFVANARGAAANGIAIGAYFTTQAVNETEATEEANFTVGAIAQYGITWPVAIHIENIKNDTPRTEKLSMEERTRLVKIWLDTVKSFGFTPMILADRNTLIRDIDLSRLSGFPVFLSDPVDYSLARDAGLSVDPEVKVTAAPSVPSGTGSSTGSRFNSTQNTMQNSIPNSTQSVTTTSSSSDIQRPVSGSSVYTDISAMSQKSSYDRKSSSTAERVSGEGEAAAESGEEVKTEHWYTDFPYRFSIWQYNRTGTVDGINGPVSTDISFIDYSAR